jgi:hypothetical protein
VADRRERTFDDVGGRVRAQQLAVIDWGSRHRNGEGYALNMAAA